MLIYLIVVALRNSPKAGYVTQDYHEFIIRS